MRVINNPVQCLIATMATGFAATFVGLQLPNAAIATQLDLLRAETASSDTQSSSSASDSAGFVGDTRHDVTKGELSPLPVKTLQGGVRKHQAAVDANDTGNLQNAQQDQTAAAESPLREVALKKLAAKVELTSEEYRSLGAGCSGYESYRPFFQPVARVTVVYADSPADKAGLKKGDKIISHDDDSSAKDNPTVPLDAVTCGQAGTPVHITALRRGQEVELTMIRMNIEDIKETKYRKQWEQLLRDLGYPQSGTYVGRNLKSLKAISDQ